jgi:hypothetical protein
MMRATLVAAISSGLALTASAGDLDLMVGLRSVIAAAIRDDGYNCPDVKRMVDLGPDKWGSVLKITCGPVGRDETWDDRPLRVTAYAEGDFTTKPWPRAAPAIERDDFSSSRHPALPLCLSMIFSENRSPLFGIMQ